MESLATKRARERGYGKGPEWYCEFRTSPAKGLEHEPGVYKRDPSSVLKIGGLYHTWFTRSSGEVFGFGCGDPDKKVFPWDQSEIHHAVSRDGYVWEERGLAVGRGEPGAYDDRSVFTPEVLAHGGKFYLVYQCVKSPYVVRVKNTVGMAVAESPDGPWKKLDGPILVPSGDGEWLGDEDNRFLTVKRGSFDSHKVHDPVLFPYKGKFFLYYKGEIMGESMTCGGRETKWGVAVADRITGPYVKSPYNPVSNSGHETILWPFGGGMAALLTTDGPERNTVQFAQDGVNFEIMAYIKGAPEACGPFRADEGAEDPLDGIRWGLCHELGADSNAILRFDLDLTQKNIYQGKKHGG